MKRKRASDGLREATGEQTTSMCDGSWYGVEALSRGQFYVFPFASAPLYSLVLYWSGVSHGCAKSYPPSIQPGLVPQCMLKELDLYVT